jgi:hypothetical protein
MINDEATTHEKQGTVGVQVEPIVISALLCDATLSKYLFS